MNFDVSRYYTIYRFQLGGSDEIIVPEDTACFRTFFGCVNSYNPKKGVEITVTMFYPGNTTIRENSNVCILDEEELNLYLRELQQWINFDYTLVMGKEQIEVAIKTNELFGKIKALLTAIRLCYEQPYNVCMKEAINLFKLQVYPNLSIIYTYHLVQSMITFPLNYGHCFFTGIPSPLLIKSFEELKARLVDTNYGCINNFFEFNTSKIIRIGFKKNAPNEFFLDSSKQLKMSTEDIMERVENYHNHNYKLLFNGQTD